MIRRYEFGTVQQYHKHREERREVLWIIGALIASMALWFGGIWFFGTYLHRNRSVANAPGQLIPKLPDALAVPIDTESPVEITDGHYVVSLNYAVTQWELALNRIIPRPKLFTGHCQGDGQVAACADIAGYSVTIDRPSGYCDMETILLHEMGHLLGVPHIEGDPLMDQMYRAKVAVPTPAAVAIARLKIKALAEVLRRAKGDSE